MTRDVAFGFLFSLLLHGGVMWFMGHIRHEVVPPEPLPAVLNLYVSKPSPSGKPAAPSGKKAQTTPNNRQTALQKATLQPEQRSAEMVRMKPATQTTPPKARVAAPEPILKTPKIQSNLQSKNLVRRGPQKRKTRLATVKKTGPLDIQQPSPQSLERSDQWTPPIAKHKDTDQIVPLKQTPGGVPHHPGVEKRSGTERQAYAPDRGGGGVVEATPNYAVNPKPPYPRLAIRRGYEGTVTLLVEVLEDGSVREVEIFRSSGYSVLDRSALKSVRKWRFIPGRRAEKAVTMKVRVPVVFRLKKGRNG